MNIYDSKKSTQIFVHIFTLTVSIWFIVGLFLSYIAYYFCLDSIQCSLCNQLANTFPFVDVAAAKSDYPSVMRIIWLFFLITTPIVLLIFLSIVPFLEFKTKFGKVKGSVYVICNFFIFGLLIILFFDLFLLDGGPDVYGSRLRWAKIYAHTVFGAFIICYTQFLLVSFSIFFIARLSILYYNILRGKHNGS